MEKNFLKIKNKHSDRPGGDVASIRRAVFLGDVSIKRMEPFFG
jgi:hypothetical protein